MIEKVSSVSVLGRLFMLSVSFPLVIFPLHGLGGIILLDPHFSYTPDQVYEHLTLLAADGRAAYVQMALSSDLLFPVVYLFDLSCPNYPDTLMTESCGPELHAQIGDLNAGMSWPDLPGDRQILQF
ncbi:MAG: hypothetical protein GY703_18225 [Gammaproteobacteria bacterium]|nr:hypothetical protein [Gammaproteobacteria bacterium]